MIAYWLDVYLCGLVVLGELIGAIIIALLIQGVVYQLTGFSIYKFLEKKLFN